MRIFLSKPWLRALSALFGNLSAGWFGVAFITPNFADIASLAGAIVLTGDIFLGILLLLVVVRIEKELEK